MGAPEQPEVTLPVVAVHTEDTTSVALIVARLEGTINTNFAVIRSDINQTRGMADDHERRIRHLEQSDTPTRAEVKEAADATKAELQRVEAALEELNRWRWKLIGFFAAISTIVTIATAVVTSLITSH